MKTSIKQLAFAAPVLVAILVTFNSFKPAERNSIANGGGIADGSIHFNLNVVKQKDGSVVGHIQFGENTYSVTCAEWFGSSAILYTAEGKNFLVVDNGQGKNVTDYIDDIDGSYACGSLDPVDFYAPHYVTDGNIQVKQ